jgi:hypothetical protein
MRISISFVLCGLGLLAIAGCTLLKPNREATASNSAPAAERSTPAPTPVTTNATPAEESHPNDTAPGGGTETDELHTPAKGTEERQAIMDALRGNQQVVFQVNYLKVHNGWCWVDTTPLDKGGRATAEGGPNLLHQENGNWKVKDLSKVPDDPNDPLGPEDASPTYIRNVMKTFPGVPRDIFPKAGK